MAAMSIAGAIDLALRLVARRGFPRLLGFASDPDPAFVLAATLASVARVTPRGGLFGVDLVPDVPRWSEYRGRVSLRGTGLRRGTHLTLVESVRQDRRRRLTIFDQEYIERRGRSRRAHTFSLVFRTLSVPQMVRRIERAGFRIEAVLGDYEGGPWDPRADVWLILARRR